MRIKVISRGPGAFLKVEGLSPKCGGGLKRGNNYLSNDMNVYLRCNNDSKSMYGTFFCKGVYIQNKNGWYLGK